MHERYRASRSYSQQEAFVYASGLTAASTPPRVRVPSRAVSPPVEMRVWQFGAPACELAAGEIFQQLDIPARDITLPALWFEEMCRHVRESPVVSPPKLAPEEVVKVEDLLATMEGAARLSRPPQFHELARKVVERAESEAEKPLTPAEVEEWAWRLADEASKLTD